MRLSLGFMSPLGKPLPWIWTGLWGIVGILFLFAVLLVYRASQFSGETETMIARLAELEQKKQTIKVSDNAPSPAALRTLSQRISMIKLLDVSKGWSTSRLLARLESLLPNYAYLTSVHHKRKVGEVVIIAEAKRVKDLTKFLKRLELEPHFEEILLAKQLRSSRSGSEYVQFEIRIKERAI